LSNAKAVGYKGEENDDDDEEEGGGAIAVIAAAEEVRPFCIAYRRALSCWIAWVKRVRRVKRSEVDAVEVAVAVGSAGSSLTLVEGVLVFRGRAIFSAPLVTMAASRRKEVVATMGSSLTATEDVFVFHRLVLDGDKRNT